MEMQDVRLWARKEGVQDAGFIAQGRAFIATANITPGTTIFSIPQHLLLHEGRAWSDSEYGTAFMCLKEAVGDALDRRWILCLQLLLEKARGKDSFWAAYINVLPTVYSDPLWWAREDVTLLEGTRLGAAAEHHGENLEQLGLWRQQLCDLNAELGGSNLLQSGCGGWGMTDEALRWAKSTVWSRAFNVPYLGGPGKEGIALLPVGDMLDHCHDRHMAWHTGADGKSPFTFITHHPISKGDAVYSNYGYKSNEELILGYGFMLEDNPADFFHVSLGLHAQAEHDKERVVQRRALLAQLGLPTEYYLTLARALPSTLLAATAVCLMPDAQAYELLTSSDGPAEASRAQRDGRAQPGSNGHENHSTDAADGLSGRVPGTIEVRAAPMLQERGARSGGKVPLTQGRQLDCSFQLRLEALKAVRQQLKRKLADIQGGSPDADLELASKQAPGSATYMALMYRAGQKRVANEALAALSQEASDLIREVQAKSQALSASDTSATVQSDNASGDECLEQAAAAHSKQLQSGAEPSQSMCLIEVLPGSVPWDRGLACVLNCEPGKALATEPLSGAFSAGSTEQLVLVLAAARCRPWLRSQAGSDKNSLLTRLCNEVEVPLAAKILHHDPEAIHIVASLVGTPAEQALQSACEELAEQWALHKDRLAQAVAREAEEDAAKTVTEADLLDALAWAEAVVERSSFMNTKSGRAAVTQLTSALPKAYWGTAVDIRWANEDRGDALQLTAAASMQGGLRLQQQPLTEGASFECLLLDWGPSVAAHALQEGKVKMAYELCIAPGEEDTGSVPKAFLLTNSAIGSTHWLTSSSSQESVLAAIAVCAAHEDQLTSFGAADLSKAAQSAINSIGTDAESSPAAEGLQGGSKHVTEEEAEKLWSLQQSFAAAVLGCKPLMKTARVQLRELLRSASEELQEISGEAANEGGGLKWGKAATDYRTSMSAIIAHHLSMLRTEKKRKVNAE